MSLYNAICGMTPGYEILLKGLGLTAEMVARFRDCFMNEDLEIVVYARIGGGNRETYNDFIDAIRRHPLFVRDYDDDFDSTFAYFVFRFPNEHFDEKMWRRFYEATTKRFGTPRERFDKMLGKLNDPNTPKDDPDLVRMMEIGKKVLAPIKEQIGDGDTAEVNIVSLGRKPTDEDLKNAGVPVKVIEVHSDGDVTTSEI